MKAGNWISLKAVQDEALLDLVSPKPLLLASKFYLHLMETGESGYDPVWDEDGACLFAQPVKFLDTANTSLESLARSSVKEVNQSSASHNASRTNSLRIISFLVE